MQVIAKKKKVLICNPKAVETGLNNLTYFSTGIWVQNPNANAIMLQQANGRLHRPGQKSDEVRVFLPYYADTTQEAQFTLLAHKIAASQQTDGLDVTNALVAAGAGIDDDAIDAMALGQAIYNMMQRGGSSSSAVSSRFMQAVTQAHSPVKLPAVEKTEKKPVDYTMPTGQQMQLLEVRSVYGLGG